MPQNKKKQPKSPSTKKSWFYFNISLRVLHSLFLVAISFLILGGSLALGIGVGYFAFLVEDTAAPSKEELHQENCLPGQNQAVLQQPSLPEKGTFLLECALTLVVLWVFVQNMQLQQL